MRTIKINFIEAGFAPLDKPVKSYSLNVPDDLANEAFEALCSHLFVWSQYKAVSETQLQHYLRVLKL